MTKKHCPRVSKTEVFAIVHMVQLFYWSQVDWQSQAGRQGFCWWNTDIRLTYHGATKRVDSIRNYFISGPLVLTTDDGSAGWGNQYLFLSTVTSISGCYRIEPGRVLAGEKLIIFGNCWTDYHLAVHVGQLHKWQCWTLGLLELTINESNRIIPENCSLY